MGLSKEEAYEILGLPNDSSLEDILKSYKELALKWYPDKHQDKELATSKFEKISEAYTRLTNSERKFKDASKLPFKEMLAIFQEVFFGDDKIDDDSSDSSFDESLENEYQDNLSNFHGDHKISATEKAQNYADALIAEEEKDKKKAEKRKAKKKKRKQKKKLEKELAKKKDKAETHQSNGTSDSYLADTESKNDDRIGHESNSSDTEEEDLDPNSAFVSVIRNKSKKNLISAQKKAQGKLVTELKSELSRDDPRSDSQILRSRQVAIRGNEMASIGKYQEAVELFTEAMKLVPTDYRFYGNRSYCYERLGQFDRALKDAEKAISLSSQWPKGYFRKGRALTGLKKYTEAEHSFEEVLKLDKDCEDAIQELSKIRTLQISDMGFSKQDAESAIEFYGSVDAALDALLAGASKTKLVASNDSEIYISDDEESGPIRYIGNHVQAADDKMNPRNPDGMTSLWVGNVREEATEKVLVALFSKYGTIISIRVLPEKFCAFINYSDKKSAGKAMQALQGKELCGQKLVIRFPNNPGNADVTILRKTKLTVSKATTATATAAAATKPRVTGPVNGGECYFWRTTGCVYGPTCRYKHVKEHQGIDKKPWHDVKDS